MKENDAFEFFCTFMNNSNKNTKNPVIYNNFAEELSNVQIDWFFKA